MAAIAIRLTEVFAYGFEETMTSLIQKAPVILTGTALIAGIGYLAAGSAAATVAAKISYCLLSTIYSLGHPEIVAGINTRPEAFSRFLGNITPLVIPPLFFLMQ